MTRLREATEAKDEKYIARGTGKVPTGGRDQALAEPSWLCLSLDGNRFSQSGTRLSCGWTGSGLAAVGMGLAVFGCVKV